MAFTRLTNFLWIGINFISTVLFLYGYFSVDEKLSVNLNSFNQNAVGFNSTGFDAIRNHCKVYKEKPIFNKMVFILIDALRSDFVPNSDGHGIDNGSSSMPFTSRLLSSNVGAVKLTSIAQTPTVTMPRLKAILAGIKPNFLDLIRNLNAVSFNEDNLIDRAKQSGKRMIFYGDDTWLKMFPGETFIRHDVTYSFFATDYTQVDTNVTENMKPELSKLDEWDFLILHYLGVDHIGHSYGSKSHLMPQKLNEMDSVLKSIYTKVYSSTEPYLIIVTGDHGMTNEGNHGGSTEPETETALIFIHSKGNSTNNHQIQKSTDKLTNSVQQIDIAVTISLLFGIPIPSKSHGIVITSLFDQWSIPLEQTTCYLFENSIQLSELMKFSSPTITTLSKALNGHYKFVMVKNKTSSVENLKSIDKVYINFLKSAQKELTNQQDSNTMIGLAIQIVAITLNLFSALKIGLNESKEINSVIFNNLFNQPIQTFTLLALILRVLLLASTSFIEMEHFFWFYLSSTIVILNGCRLLTIERIIPSIFNFMSLPFDYAVKIIGHIVALILIRLISSWQTLITPTLGQLFTTKSTRSIATALTIIFLTLISFLSNLSRFSKQQCILVSGLFWIYLYRCDTNFLTTFRLPFINLIPSLSSLFKARLVYLHILMLLVENFLKRRRIDFDCNLIDGLLPKNSRRNADPTPSILRTFTVCWILLICLLTKLVNIPLIVLSIGLEKMIYLIVRWSLNNDFSNIVYFISTYLTFAMTFHYGQGNSNDISTIEVAAGYIGLDDYMPMFTGILIASHTYSQLTLWLLMMFVRLTEIKSSLISVRTTKVINGTFSFLLTLQFTTVGYFMIVALILRNHLFIWTVISPKLLYESFQSFMVFMIAVMVTICTQLNR
ncbi:GPI ethanolamine phosphate transferase 2-like [Panonychus citri]|uniref:GPI ethanolamine phosphate transferase 2-like n=1 Tax=Panonychus citri TaxID=50023 RepID=UPI002307F37B|nr:GPI ethanolamine phosphate transferase 2-like [Panonychus citri]